jgi:DeoR/GlpR family transcriptional regulator of sugar metabolism
MRYERSLAINKRHKDLLALIRGGAHSSPYLAEELGVSEQTIYRDILFLKKQGYIIKAVKLSVNWAYKLLPKSNNHQQKRRAT